MPKFKLYDYVDDNGVNIIKSWTQSLEKAAIAKLNSKLDILQKVGSDLSPRLLGGTKYGHIKKLKVHGNVQLRPMLCEGPIYNSSEFTLLIGASERDRKLIPKNAATSAEQHREKVILNPGQARCEHERVTC